MVQRIAPIRVISFLVLAACGALCQEPQAKVWSISLPDAPSVEASAQANLNRAAQSSYIVFRKEEPVQNEPGDFFSKYLYPSLLQRKLNYHPSTNGTLMGRASYAASRTFITRDESGKGKLNTSYFIRVLSSAALHTASVPYWRRTISAPFSNFGSTIGNDAGMNVLHEFEPGIERVLKGHTPKFVSAIEQRVGRN